MIGYICLAILVLFFAVLYLLFRIAFGVPRKITCDPYNLPTGEEYDSMHSQMEAMVRHAMSIPCEKVQIKSYDGLSLNARLYRVTDEPKVQIMMHGYQSMAVRDMCGGMPIALEMGWNVILPDQRAHGESEGKFLTFGIKERDDVKSWIEYAIDIFGPDVKIVLVGISMGAATVMMASGLDLPSNVIGIASDCGYTSPKEIIQKVMKDRHIPVFPFYQLVRLSARIYGGFNLEEKDTISSMAKSKLPFLFIHGEADNFVPCEMSVRNYNAYEGNKHMLLVPNAPHGLSFLVNEAGYKGAVKEFLERITE